MKKNLLRSLVLSLFFVLGSWFCTSAQWVSIPDTNFGTWLNTYGYSACLQGNNTVGWQMDTTCNYVTSNLSLYCVYAQITDLTGIEYFDNLEILTCAFSQLTSLNNILGGLELAERQLWAAEIYHQWLRVRTWEYRE